MPRWLFGALGAVALLAVGGLLWELRRTPSRPATSSPAASLGAATGQPPGVSDRPPAGGPTEARRLRHVPTEEEVGRERMQLLLADDVPQRILRAVARCYDGRDGRAERMSVRYQLRFEQGEASLAKVGLIESQLDAPELEGCVLDTMRGLSWRDRGAPNMMRKMEIEISLLDLKSRQARPADTADEPDENDPDE